MFCSGRGEVSEGDMVLQRMKIRLKTPNVVEVNEEKVRGATKTFIRVVTLSGV